MLCQVEVVVNPCGSHERLDTLTCMLLSARLHQLHQAVLQPAWQTANSPCHCTQHWCKVVGTEPQHPLPAAAPVSCQEWHQEDDLQPLRCSAHSGLGSSSWYAATGAQAHLVRQQHAATWQDLHMWVRWCCKSVSMHLKLLYLLISVDQSRQGRYA